METLETTSQVSARQAARFGRQVATAELVATITDPGRPLALMGAGLVLAVTADTVLLGGSWLSAVLSLVGCVVGWLVLIWVLTRVAEARACRRAAAAWRYEASSGAQAVALRVVDRRTDGWLLQSMAARPRGMGTGSQLMRCICAQADDTGTVIGLVAVTGRTADWYTRFGFRRVRRTLPLGQWRMERQPERRPNLGDTACKVP